MHACSPSANFFILCLSPVCLFPNALKHSVTGRLADSAVPPKKRLRDDVHAMVDQIFDSANGVHDSRLTALEGTVKKSSDEMKKVTEKVEQLRKDLADTSKQLTDSLAAAVSGMAKQTAYYGYLIRIQIQNSNRGADQILCPIRIFGGGVPRNVPCTYSAVDLLSAAALKPFLLAYNLEVTGSLAEQQVRLKQFFGLN